VAEGGGGWKKSGQVDEIQTKLCQKSQQKFYIIKIMTLMLDECGFGWGSAGEFRF